MRVPVVRLVSQIQDIDEINNSASIETMKQLITSIEGDIQPSVFHLTFLSHHLQTLIDSNPSEIEKIQKLCKERKIFIGPWFVIPNDCLANGESLIRNLFYGNKICHTIGSVMKVGFSALNCNNNSQLPQIFNGFNIDTLFIPVDASQHLPQKFYWEGTDGSKALGISNTIIRIDQLENYSLLDQIIQSQQAENNPDEAIPIVFVENANPNQGIFSYSEILVYLSSLPDVQIEQITLPDLFWMIKEDTEKRPLKILTREVIPYPKNNIQQTRINCLRIISKNNHLEQNLQMYLEPWNVIRQNIVGKNSSQAIDELWKQLLILQSIVYETPNDDFQVKQKIRSKYLNLINSVDTLYAEAVQEVLKNIKLPEKGDYGYFSVVNPLPYNRTNIIRVNVELDQKIAQENVIIEELSGNSIPCTTLKRSEVTPVFGEHDNQTRFQYDCVVELKNIPAMGYKTYRVVPVRNLPMPSRKNIIFTANVLENDFIRVTINPNGTFMVYSKETGVSYRSLGYFVDTIYSEDNGVKTKSRITSTELEPSIIKLENNTLLGSYRIDFKWSCDGMDVKDQTKISMTLSLNRLSRMVDIDIDLIDKSDNHHIEFFFPINFKVDHVYSDVRFDIQDILPSEGVQNLSQFHVAMNTLVGICDEIAGFAVISKELRSAQVTTKGKSYLSMIILNKPQNRDYRNRTTIIHYSFAFYPYIGGWENGQILRDAYNTIYDVKTYLLENKGGYLSDQMEFLNISPSSLFFSALKMDIEGNAVLRLFNPTIEYIEGSITTHYPLAGAYSLSLEDYRVEPMLLKDMRTIQLSIPPKKIVTLELIFK